MRFLLAYFVRPLFCAAAALLLAGPAIAADIGSPIPIPACRCGCMTTGECKCKNCCERTADPTWTPAQSAAALAAVPVPITTAAAVRYTTVCNGGSCQLVKVDQPNPIAVGYSTPFTLDAAWPVTSVQTYTYTADTADGTQPTTARRHPIRGLLGRLFHRRATAAAGCQ